MAVIKAPLRLGPECVITFRMKNMDVIAYACHNIFSSLLV